MAHLSDGTSTIFLCPADLVHAAPIEALPLGEGRVGDRFRVIRLPSFTPLVRPRPRATQDEPELLAIGGVDFDAIGDAPSGLVDAISAAIESGARGGAAVAFPSLPGTAAEIQSIAKRFADAPDRRATILSAAGATKAAFHDQAPGKRYVHLATHGWFAEIQLPEPGKGERFSMRWGLEDRARAFTPMSYCGLALAGANRGRDSLGRVPGIMTAEELAGVDLSDCELAVLSACETNVGICRAGMGLESLQAALHAAGARTAITSLWKVDDQATRELFELFYQYLWTEQLPKSEALWKAKCDLRAAGHPMQHWAAWVISGDPN